MLTKSTSFPALTLAVLVCLTWADAALANRWNCQKDGENKWACVSNNSQGADGNKTSSAAKTVVNTTPYQLTPAKPMDQLPEKDAHAGFSLTRIYANTTKYLAETSHKILNYFLDLNGSLQEKLTPAPAEPVVPASDTGYLHSTYTRVTNYLSETSKKLHDWFLSDTK